MEMNDAIKIIKPERDSHYRLLPCDCGSDNVAFVKYQADNCNLWRVQCFDCNRSFAPVTEFQHDVMTMMIGDS